MNEEELRKIALTTPKTRDLMYNKGKEDCAIGITYTKEAQYFMMCSGLK